ncbi:hypothetical protein [Pradoshia sp.]
MDWIAFLGFIIIPFLTVLLLTFWASNHRNDPAKKIVFGVVILQILFFIGFVVVFTPKMITWLAIASLVLMILGALMYKSLRNEKSVGGVLLMQGILVLLLMIA